MKTTNDGAVSVAHPVRDVVARLDEMSGDEHVPMHALICAFGQTSFVPALMVPALLVVSPLSGIPFFSSLCGITIALIAVQMLWRRDHLSLPGFVMRRQVPGKRLHAAMHRIEWIADWLDRHSRERFTSLISRNGRTVPQVLCLLSGASMPFLEIMPFSSSILGAAVLCFALGLLAHDGLFVLIGVAAMAVAAMVPVLLLPRIVEMV